MVTERSVEVPWCLARIAGRVIDIGSTDAEYLDVLPPGSVLLDQRPLTRPQPQDTAFLLADVRAIPEPDANFDTVLCLSVYEHFGMKHEPYNTVAEEGVAQQGLSEMWRILKPGGRLVMSVPFGKANEYGWLRQWNQTTLQHEFRGIWPYLTEITYFSYNKVTDSYLETIPELCTEDYDTSLCRSNAVACLMFTKGL